MAQDNNPNAPTDAQRRARERAQRMTREGQSSAQEYRDKVKNAEKTAAQLEAAVSGDYSKLLQGVDRKDQRDVISQADRVLSTLRGDYQNLRRSSDNYKDAAGQDRYMRSQLAKYTDVDVDALLSGQASTSTDTSTDTTTNQTATTLVDKEDWMSTGNAPSVGELTSIGVEESLATGCRSPYILRTGWTRCSCQYP